MVDEPSREIVVPSPCGDPDHVLAADGLPCEKSQKHDLTDDSLARVVAQRRALTDVPTLLTRIADLEAERNRIFEQAEAVLRSEGEAALRCLQLEAQRDTARRERDRWRTLYGRLAEAFRRHRTTTHEVAPTYCKTCRESDAALAEYDAATREG